MGEVHTGLLQHSTAVEPQHAAELLALVSGAQVRRSERPIPYAVSPDRLTGVDCRLNTTSGSRVRAIGTVVSRAAITGGHVLQGSAFTAVVRGAFDRRMPWSHYLATPGRLEALGKFDEAVVVDGFLCGATVDGALDLGAISGRTMDSVLISEVLDRQTPFRSARTRLRWAMSDADPDDGAVPRLTFAIESETMRTARLPGRSLTVATIVTLCEDFALHDWLLTTLLRMIERGRLGSGPRRRAVESLTPAIDHLLHLWMPAARVDEAVADLWESLELRPGFSRQWNACVSRIRDQLTLAAINLFADLPGPDQASPPNPGPGRSPIATAGR
jgi:hypothetical protein